MDMNEEKQQRLESLLEQESIARKYYFRLINTHLGIQEPSNLKALHDKDQDAPYDIELWKALAEQERTAPVIEIPKEKPKREPVKMLKIEKAPRVINKLSLYTAIISAAALIFMLIYVQVVPQPASSVAMIADSVHAQWEQGEHPTDIGDQLWDNEGVRWLKKGAVKIAFDYGAEVIIEGPAEFELENAEKMILHSGRLYAKVSKGATGFIVQTPYSTVIDLGTEFGVEVGFDGSTDVHMFKGKASLIPGRTGEKKESLELHAGQAKAVAQTGQVQDIELKGKAFVRAFDSKTGFLWRGQKVIDLADIVGGGNGFGTGRQSIAISPKTGNLYTPARAEERYQRDSKKPVIEVPGIQAVNCIFIPDRENDSIPVSTEGHLWDNCPDTAGVCWWGAASNFSFLDMHMRSYQVVLNNIEFGTQKKPTIAMHSNLGLTFDLDVIRDQVPIDNKVRRFQSLFGITEDSTWDSPESQKVDVWILIDGVSVYQKTGVVKGEALNIDVEIRNTARFLSLIVTDGADTIGTDWAAFGRPILELVNVDNVSEGRKKEK
jgi:hypothetical protein